MKSPEQNFGGGNIPSEEHDWEKEGEELMKELKGAAKEGERIAKENIELAAEATEDHLTGVKNRRGFVKDADAIISQISAEGAHQRGKELEHATIMIVDADHFKQVNDRFGHDVGDIVLRAIADRLKTFSRPRDVVGRWGGEEFAMVFEGATPEAILKRLGEDEEHSANATISVTVETKDGPLTVTLSGGLTEYRPGEGLRSAVNRADETLYYVKHEAGRNKILSDTEVPKTE